MPAKRVPWFKVWVGATRHEKVATLDDRAFRTWVELLDAASTQTVRGCFVNSAAAAAVVRRPVSSVKRLVDVGLMDQRDDGVWMHDWQDWQRWRPEDGTNGDGTPTDDPPINTRTTHDQHTNGSAITHDDHLNDSGTSIDQHTNNTRTTHESLSPLPPSSLPPTPPISLPPLPPEEGRNKKEKGDARASRASTVDDSFKLELEEGFWEAFGSREAVQDSIAAALGYKKLSNYSDQRAFLRNWVRGDAERSQSRRGGRIIPINGRPPVRQGVRHA